MKNYSLLLLAALVSLGFSSCSQKASISGTLAGAKDAEIEIMELDGASTKVLDTVRTNANGAYSYKVSIEKGQPEFIYIYKGDTKLASLLLSQGEKVKVVSDTLGRYSVEGSEESVRLCQVEKDFSDFITNFSKAAEEGDNQALSRQYIDYYRSRVKYVMENPKSLTCIPVLYQKINDNFYVFSQSTDAIHFRNVHDSLVKVYPDSKYVKALGDEAQRRINLMGINSKMGDAESMSYPDLDLPSIDGTRIKLSELDDKVVLLYFWRSSDVTLKMFNQEVLMPLYKRYHSRGFEIYSVSLDTDKGSWASVVNSQNLPWINVCDGLGSASPAVSAYNLSGQLPASYVIVDGEMYGEDIREEKDFIRVLDENLK